MWDWGINLRLDRMGRRRRDMLLKFGLELLLM